MINTDNSKKNIYYGIKNAGDNSVKDIDFNKRTVTGILNTYFWIDSDIDMLVPGAAKRTINNSGPDSNAIAKIKHQADHKLDTDHAVGKIKVLDERVINGNTVLYFESEIPPTDKGNDHLMNYQSLIYDQHSIGFRYVNYEKAEPNSPNEAIRGNWDKYYPLALNPEVADREGFFWVVKEIQLYEGSVVMFGANSLTQYLGSKSKDKESIKLDLVNRIDNMTNVLKNGKLTDEGFKTLQLQLLQQKQIISDLEFGIEAPKKGTPQDSSVVTPPKSNFWVNFNNNLK